jgi:hypothetical protein
VQIDAHSAVRGFDHFISCTFKSEAKESAGFGSSSQRKADAIAASLGFVLMNDRSSQVPKEG